MSVSNERDNQGLEVSCLIQDEFHIWRGVPERLRAVLSWKADRIPKEITPNRRFLEGTSMRIAFDEGRLERLPSIGTT